MAIWIWVFNLFLNSPWVMPGARRSWGREFHDFAQATAIALCPIATVRHAGTNRLPEAADRRWDRAHSVATGMHCNPIDSVKQCFSRNETRTRTSFIWFSPWCRASGVDFSWECWCDRTAAASISAELQNAWRHPVYRCALLTIYTSDRCSNPIWTVWEARVHWQRTSDWTELAKYIVRRPDELGDMTGEHQTCVDRDAETPDSCRCHHCAAVYCHWCRCNLE